MKTTIGTSQSSQHTGAGEPAASVCAGCGIQLQDTEVYACGCCLDLWLLADPNFDMTGESDG
ncbi:protein NinF [Pantoea sp. JKS000250]|uniref:protein NinF n=1 Tax=Pantoea sp. JKS000250 TaxID=1938795 RepID=UPI000D75AC67|nr:protein NinF [Pantoea sp. JKS000250]